MALGISSRAPRAKPIGAAATRSKSTAAAPRIKGLRAPGIPNPAVQQDPLGPQLGGMGLTMGMKRGIKNQALKSAGARTSSRRQSSRD